MGFVGQPQPGRTTSVLDFLPFTGHLVLSCPALHWVLGRDQDQAPGSGGFRASCNCLLSPFCATVPNKQGKPQSQGESPWTSPPRGLYCAGPSACSDLLPVHACSPQRQDTFAGSHSDLRTIPLGNSDLLRLPGVGLSCTCICLPSRTGSPVRAEPEALSFLCLLRCPPWSGCHPSVPLCHEQAWPSVHSAVSPPS